MCLSVIYSEWKSIGSVSTNHTYSNFIGIPGNWNEDQIRGAGNAFCGERGVNAELTKKKRTAMSVFIYFDFFLLEGAFRNTHSNHSLTFICKWLCQSDSKHKRDWLLPDIRMTRWHGEGCDVKNMMYKSWRLGRKFATFDTMSIWSCRISPLQKVAAELRATTLKIQTLLNPRPRHYS